MTSCSEEEELCLGLRPFLAASLHTQLAGQRERESDETISTWRRKWEEFTVPEHRGQEKRRGNSLANPNTPCSWEE